MPDGQEVLMRVEVGSEALATLDKLAATIDKMAEAEKRAAANAKEWQAQLRSGGGGGGGGGGSGSGGRGSGGGSGSGGSGGGGAGRSKRTIDEEVDERLRRQRREDRIRAEIERRNPTPEPQKQSFRQRLQERIEKDESSAKLKDRVDRHFGRGKYKPAPEEKAPKTFHQEVEEAVSLHRKRNALNAAIEARINPGAGRDRALSGIAQVGQAGSGGIGGAISGLGRLGAVGAVAAAALLAFKAGLDKTTELAKIERDGTMTRAQKDRAITEELVPFAQSIRKFREAVDGTTETLARNQRRIALAQVETGAGIAKAAKAIGYTVPFHQAENLATAYRNAGPIGGMPMFDRSTAIGQRAATERDITLPALDEQRRAGIASTAARRNYASISEEAMGQHERTQQTEKRAKAAAQAARDLRDKENVPGSGVNKAAIDKAYTKAREADLEYAEDQAKEERLILAAKEAGVHAAEQESKYRKASIESAKAELEVLKQREDRMAGMAQKLGSMNQADFEIAKAMLQQVREQGLENLPAELGDIAAQVAPEYVAKQREALGEKRARQVAQENQGIDDSTLAQFEKSTLGEIRAQVDRVKADVRVSINLDAELMAKEVAKTLGDWLMPFLKSITVEMEAIKRRFELEREQGYNSNRP